MQLDKTFNIADVLNLNIYIQAINIFDTQNINNVFLRTGTPYDDGYLSDPAQGEINAAALVITSYSIHYTKLYEISS